MKVIHVFGTGEQAYGRERTVMAMVPALRDRGVDARVLAVVEVRAGGRAKAVAKLLERCRCPFEVVETATRWPFGIARYLRRLCRREKPDIIHSHDYKCDVALLLSRAKAAKVASVHGWCSRSARERFYEWVSVQCIKRMDRSIALCEDYRARLVRRGVRADRIRVAHVGVDLAAVLSEGRDCRAEWGVSADDVLVVQVGRASPEKNPRLFIDVARRLVPRFPHVRFALVGDGPMMDVLQAEAADLAGRLVFAGYVRGIGDVFQAADIVVNSSTTEGLPGALLEAGAMGRPTVATAVGGVGEIIDDGATGLLCPSGDAAALTEAVARLIEDAGLRREMGAAADQRVMLLFSLESCTDRLIEVYEELLA